MHLGERIKEERERLGLNQADFAELADSTRKTLFNWESGAATPNATVLAAWAAHGLDVLYVVTGQRSLSMPATDPAEQVLLDSYRRCGAQAKQNLIQTAALLSAGLGGLGVATAAHARGGVSQSNVHGSNHFVAGDSATSVPAKSRKRAA
ncbi:MAG: helix-turn-helix domain-containing protein [Burkholderiaceae bacterium]|nr:helix-turn-helix domain-containing protein [Burkholderiaceae bacterium]